MAEEAVLAVALECHSILEDCIHYRNDVQRAWERISGVLQNDTTLGATTKDSIERYFCAKLLELNEQRGSASNKRGRTHDVHPGPDLGIRDVPSPASAHHPLTTQDRPLAEASSSAGSSRYTNVVFPEVPQNEEDSWDGNAPAKKTRRRSRTSMSEANENRSGPSRNKGKEKAPLLLASSEWESEDSSSAMSNESDESSSIFHVFDEDAEETASDISDGSSQQQVEDLILPLSDAPDEAQISFHARPEDLQAPQEDHQNATPRAEHTSLQPLQQSDVSDGAQIGSLARSEDLQAPRSSRSVTPTQGEYGTPISRAEPASLQSSQQMDVLGEAQIDSLARSEDLQTPRSSRSVTPTQEEYGTLTPRAECTSLQQQFPAHSSENRTLQLSLRTFQGHEQNTSEQTLIVQDEAPVQSMEASGSLRRPETNREAASPGPGVEVESLQRPVPPSPLAPPQSAQANVPPPHIPQIGLYRSSNHPYSRTAIVEALRQSVQNSRSRYPSDVPGSIRPQVNPSTNASPVTADQVMQALPLEMVPAPSTGHGTLRSPHPSNDMEVDEGATVPDRLMRTPLVSIAIESPSVQQLQATSSLLPSIIEVDEGVTAPDRPMEVSSTSTSIDIPSSPQPPATSTPLSADIELAREETVLDGPTRAVSVPTATDLLLSPQPPATSTPLSADMELAGEETVLDRPSVPTATDLPLSHQPQGASAPLSADMELDGGETVLDRPSVPTATDLPLSHQPQGASTPLSADMELDGGEMVDWPIITSSRQPETNTLTSPQSVVDTAVIPATESQLQPVPLHQSHETLAEGVTDVMVEMSASPVATGRGLLYPRPNSSLFIDHRAPRLSSPSAEIEEGMSDMPMGIPLAFNEADTPSPSQPTPTSVLPSANSSASTSISRPHSAPRLPSQETVLAGPTNAEDPESTSTSASLPQSEPRRLPGEALPAEATMMETSVSPVEANNVISSLEHTSESSEAALYSPPLPRATRRYQGDSESRPARRSTTPSAPVVDTASGSGRHSTVTEHRQPPEDAPTSGLEIVAPNARAVPAPSVGQPVSQGSARADRPDHTPTAQSFDDTQIDTTRDQRVSQEQDTAMNGPTSSVVAPPRTSSPLSDHLPPDNPRLADTAEDRSTPISASNSNPGGTNAVPIPSGETVGATTASTTGPPSEFVHMSLFNAVVSALGGLRTSVQTLADRLESQAAPRQPLENRQRRRTNIDNVDGHDADDESDRPHEARPKRLSHRTKHRNPSANDLARDVRRHNFKLTGIPERGAIDLTLVPTAREVALWDPAGGFSATSAVEGSFRIDLCGTAHSAWNVSASSVFVDDFISCQQYVWNDRTAIRRAWFANFQTLKRRFEKYQKSQEDQVAWRKAHNRANRKYFLFQRRLTMAMRYNQTQNHVDMLRAVGMGGMSSDESDAEGQSGKQYRILRPVWRHERVTAWLRVFDGLFNRFRLNGGYFETLQGGWPRVRLVSDRVSSSARPAVRQLPRNAYSSSWWDQQAAPIREDIHPGADYDFTHGPDIINLVSAPAH